MELPVLFLYFLILLYHFGPKFLSSLANNFATDSPKLPHEPIDKCPKIPQECPDLPRAHGHNPVLGIPPQLHVLELLDQELLELVELHSFVLDEVLYG